MSGSSYVLKKKIRKLRRLVKNIFLKGECKDTKCPLCFKFYFWDHPHTTFALGGGSQKADEGEGGYAYLDIHILLFQEGMILRGKLKV